ncbi:MAG: hypothetical protein EAX95_10940 [Candidatus Thorarchaeota archaeon]|nr:hypothetical protein [Candidatus Thorarchaeota archaeon]
MRGKWPSIAKAEFLVLTSRFRKQRYKIIAIAVLLSFCWATILSPAVISLVLELFFTGLDLELFLWSPGTMRLLIMALWLMLIAFPITNALSDITTAQWEILLSNNASTFDILVGTYIGSSPVYGLAILVFAPVIIAPLVIVCKVTFLGQALLYISLLFIVLGALWFSTLLCTALQAKLGSSMRGDDIAKALVVGFALVAVISVYGFLFFGQYMVEIVGLDLFRVFPFTWGADIIIWIALLFNNAGLSQSHIASVESMLGFNLATNVLLLSVFSFGLVVLGVKSADRFFTLGKGQRSEKVTTAGRENVILRVIRRLFVGSAGVLIVTAMKDFGRKTQNASKLAYGIVMAVILPIMIRLGVAGFTDPEGLFVVSGLVVSIMLSMAGGMTFGGIGFLDSRNQLWMLKSAPNGVNRFVRARVAESMLFALPMAIIASLAVSFVMGLGIIESVLVLTCAYLSLTGTIMIATGLTANNPNYEDTKSKAFKDNTGATVICIMIITQMTLLLLIEAGLRNPLAMIFAPGFSLLVVGILFTIVGTRRLSRPE